MKRAVMIPPAMTIHRPAAFFWGLMVFLFLSMARPLAAQEVFPPLTIPKELRMVGISTLQPGVNIQDARLALEIIMHQAIVRQSYPFRIKLDYINDYRSADTRVVDGRYHFVTLTSLDYLSLSVSVGLTPLMILSKHEQPTEILYLVIARDSRLEDIAKGTRRILMIDRGRIGELSRLWVDTQLWKSGYPSSDRFFTQIQTAKNNNQLLLSVFFGQADACVISASAYAVMAELNPQIGIRLQVAEQSPGLVILMLCATDLAGQDVRDLMLSEALRAENDPAARQALTTIQMARIIPFKAAFFSATETLVRQHRQLAAINAKGNF